MILAYEGYLALGISLSGKFYAILLRRQCV